MPIVNSQSKGKEFVYWLPQYWALQLKVGFLAWAEFVLEFIHFSLPPLEKWWPRWWGWQMSSGRRWDKPPKISRLKGRMCHLKVERTCHRLVVQFCIVAYWTVTMQTFKYLFMILMGHYFESVFLGFSELFLRCIGVQNTFRRFCMDHCVAILK
jgi:hypothetical protein